MIDYFALALTHALLVLALLRIAARPELDREEWDLAAEPEETQREPTGREARTVRRKPKSQRDA